MFSYFRVFVIDLEELPRAMASSRFPRGSSRRPSPCNGPPRRLAPQLQRLDACRETNCGGMRSNRSRKHESTKTRKWPRWRRSLARGGFLSSSIETPRSDARSIDVNRSSKNKLRLYLDRRFLGLPPSVFRLSHHRHRAVPQFRPAPNPEVRMRSPRSMAPSR